MTTPTVPFAEELELATRLALEAGALIRDEFHRPGGPRSDGRSHAEVDVEAEKLISDGIRARFPGDAFVAEERGGWGERSASRLWMVDPHDGTSAFIEGHRGSAVSIALSVDGELVLGVVYAPTAPDDGGDLVTWTRGAPLRRNGEPVTRAPLPAALAPDVLVVFNARADQGARLAQALAMAAPGRVLTRASIAYRLALVAVGEADAAVSTSGPTDWDVAGGHALLLASGGVLLDARGEPVRYGVRKTGPTDVFGGHPEVAKLLAQRARTPRPAAPVLGPLAKAYPHVRPSHAHKVRDAAVLRRAQGALLGQVAGDALGQLVEFESRTSVFKRYPGGVRELVDGGAFNLLAGQPTDDSELALLLARTIVADGAYQWERAQTAYEAWLDSKPFDVGTTTRRGLRGEGAADSASNGSAMRISPLGVYLWRNEPDDVASDAASDSAITHESATCVEATIVLAVAIATAVREGLPPRDLYARVAGWVRTNEKFDSPVKALFAEDDVTPVKDFHTHPGHVLIALRNAFHQLLHAPSLEEGLVRTVSQGGDADTNGAIAGALLGAVYGREAVPLRWRRTVLSCRATHGQHPRPEPFWATDLLELAERLVALGPKYEFPDEEPEADPAVVSLAGERQRKQGDAAARKALHAALRQVIGPLQSAAEGLAIRKGLAVMSDQRPDEHGVSARTLGLQVSEDPDVARVGHALELIERILGDASRL